MQTDRPSGGEELAEPLEAQVRVRDVPNAVRHQDAVEGALDPGCCGIHRVAQNPGDVSQSRLRSSPVQHAPRCVEPRDGRGRIAPTNGRRRQASATAEVQDPGGARQTHALGAHAQVPGVSWVEGAQQVVASRDAIELGGNRALLQAQRLVHLSDSRDSVRWAGHLRETERRLSGLRRARPLGAPGEPGAPPPRRRGNRP